jgi:hypothetical protein
MLVLLTIATTATESSPYFTVTLAMLQALAHGNATFLAARRSRIANIKRA